MERKLLLPIGSVGLLVCLLVAQFPVPSTADVNGGTTCAGCTIILSLVDQVAEMNNESAVDALTRLCGYLPDQFQTACKGFLDFATPILLDLILEKYNADVACHALTLCYVDPGQQACLLYPNQQQIRSGGIRAVLKSLYQSKEISKQTKQIMMGKGVGLKSDICDSLPGLKGLCEWLEGHINNHTAVSDIDQDKFGITETLRGSHWRGKDCDDFDKTVYPGRRPKNNDEETDSDCNGIYGVNPATGKTFEEDYCANSDHRGVLLLSDSAGAHFHIPGEWMTASKLSADVFKHVLMVVEDEFDWPELSGTTGYMNTTWDIVHGLTDSLYYKLVQRNRCNHRDFQNIGVNGARAEKINTIAHSMSRDPNTDHPAIVMYSLIGNDVCNGHPDTIAHMTTPEQMKAYSLSSLKYLDTRLPKGSFVIVTGMADGRVLYELMANRIHPLGQYNQDITYKHVYDLLSCLQVSPCNGWMSSNETLRNYTSERAANLSKALEEVVQSNKFMNFKPYYIDYDIRTVIKEWEDMGGEGWQMVEPIDGFHPSQDANYMTAKHVWKQLETTYPEIIGKVNPNNDAIYKQFGDQGGY
ncbi:acyloxyacyl hydrolase-like isoform X2 [Amphiura filiformis]|uniref:acyloxyacyl hydrolase-like isoform X2 n=1 Tax=Amphiura filiformis TaxID=82378 RepID=UPI003B211611